MQRGLDEFALLHLKTPRLAQCSGVGTHLQGNILIFYGVTENPLERKLLASLRVLHEVNGAETTLRNLADYLVPGKKLLP